MTASDGNHIGLNAHDLIASLMSKHVKSVTQELINDVYNATDQVHGGSESSSLPKYFLIENETKAGLEEAIVLDWQNAKCSQKSS